MNLVKRKNHITLVHSKLPTCMINERGELPLPSKIRPCFKRWSYNKNLVYFNIKEFSSSFEDAKINEAEESLPNSFESLRFCSEISSDKSMVIFCGLYCLTILVMWFLVIYQANLVLATPFANNMKEDKEVHTTFGKTLLFPLDIK